MINFLKKQFFKITVYIIILILINVLWFFSEWNISILVSLNSLITSLFTFIIGKTWLEDYKLEVNKELEKYKIKLSGYTLVTKLQYDLEFKIYTEIYEKMFLLYIETEKLRPIIDVAGANIRERLNSFSNIYNETSRLINKYRPFYSEEIYNILTETRNECLKESTEVEISIDDIKYYNYAHSLVRKREIKENLEKISILIRNRIENMKIIED